MLTLPPTLTTEPNPIPNQSRLLDTVRAALRAHGASVQRRYSLLLPCQQRLAVRGACISQQGLGVAAPLARLARRRPASVLVDRQFHTSLQPSHALALLRQHVCESLLFLDGQHFMPRAGVPQGSVASALLCCL